MGIRDRTQPFYKKVPPHFLVTADLDDADQHIPTRSSTVKRLPPATRAAVPPYLREYARRCCDVRVVPKEMLARPTRA